MECQNPLKLTKLHLSEFASASAHHTVGESALDHGSLEKINTKYRQGIFSTTLDDLHEKWNLPLPDYIKIDVDGIEHKIIEGCNKILKNNSDAFKYVVNEGFSITKENQIFKTINYRVYFLTFQ